MAASDNRNTSLEFNPGGRPYSNKDFRILQQLVFDTTSFFQAFTNVNAGQFIVSGCSTLGASGFVWLGTYNIDPALNDRRLRYVDTWQGSPLSYPCYIGTSTSFQTRTYKDGVIKNVFRIAIGYWSQTVPASGVYLTFNNASDFLNFKLETTFGSIGASYWTQVPSTSNILYASGNAALGSQKGSDSTYAQFQIGTGSALIGNKSNVDSFLSSNLYYDSGTFKYRLSNSASLIGLQGNVIRFFESPTGTADASTVPTEIARFDSSGKFGVGTSTPVGKIHAIGDIRADNGTGTGSVSIVGGNGSQAGYIEFKIPSGTRQGYMGWTTAALEITLENSYNFGILGGNVGIGTSSPGTALDVNGTFRASGISTFNGAVNVNAITTVNSLSTSTINMSKSGFVSTINFAAQTNDPGYIQHYENSNQATMYFSVSDDFGTTDYFSFGAAPGGSYTEGVRIYSNGQSTFNNAMTIASGNLTLSSGTGTASDWIATSDVSLKENISTIDNALDVTLQLQGHSYNMKDNNKKRYGFIAQEVEKVLPELVEFIDSNKKLKGVNYDKVTPILVEAIKQQQQLIEELTQRIKKLESNI